MKTFLLLTFFINTIRISSLHAYSYHPMASQLDNPSRKFQRSYSVSNNKPDAEFPQQPRQFQGDDPVAVGERQLSADAIVYPQSHKSVTRSTDDVTGYNCNYGFCEDADNYPGEYIRNLLKRTNAYDAFFNASLPQTPSREAFGFENLCNAVVTKTFPRTALNIEKKSRVIANYGEYQQGMQTETCLRKDTACQFSQNFPLQYELKCEQKFMVTPLLALDDDKNLIVDTFLAPSCCVCMYRSK